MVSQSDSDLSRNHTGCPAHAVPLFKQFLTGIVVERYGFRRFVQHTLGRDWLDGYRDTHHAQDVQPLEGRSTPRIRSCHVAFGSKYVWSRRFSRKPVLCQFLRYGHRHYWTQNRHGLDLCADVQLGIRLVDARELHRWAAVTCFVRIDFGRNDSLEFSVFIRGAWDSFSSVAVEQGFIGSLRSLKGQVDNQKILDSESRKRDV